MGLLDSLGYGNQGGYGGLLDALMYPSPLSKPEEVQQPQYDVMGNYTGITPQASNPFGPPPAFDPRQYAPQSVFNGNAPTSVVPFSAPMQSQAPALPPPQTVAPAPQPAPPQNVPDRSLNVGGYQMPQFGSAPLVASVPSTDISAQSRALEQALPPALEGRSILGRIGNPDGLIARLTGNDSRSIAQQNLRATYEATRDVLKQSGMGEQEASSKAMLAVLNPEAGKTILPEALTSKQEFKTIKDALGAEHGYWIDKLNQTMKPAEGGGSGGALGQGPALLASGVSQYNPSLSGQEYLNQFGPEVKAAVQAYIKGDVMPTGNPRLQAISSKAKEIAQKYGADMGIPVSDALYSEKRKYFTELGTNSPNSAGGQAKAFNQGISHMTALAGTLEKLDNSNGLGIPALAQGVNAVRQGVSTSQSAIADEAKSIGQTVAGEVGKLFSGSAGGGVHERELTRERFDTIKSKPQLAAALRATLETMQGGLQALEQRRDSILGPNSGVDLVSDATRANIAKIQGTIDRLEGKSSASGGLPSGWSVRVH